jgi:hypothetical protein
MSPPRLKLPRRYTQYKYLYHGHARTRPLSLSSYKRPQGHKPLSKTQQRLFTSFNSNNSSSNSNSNSDSDSDSNTNSDSNSNSNSDSDSNSGYGSNNHYLKAEYYQ